MGEAKANVPNFLYIFKYHIAKGLKIRFSKISSKDFFDQLLGTIKFQFQMSTFHYRRQLKKNNK